MYFTQPRAPFFRVDRALGGSPHTRLCYSPQDALGPSLPRALSFLICERGSGAGRQCVMGTELTHSGNSQSSRPKGPDYPHPDSDRPAGHSRAITAIFFKMAHGKPGPPLPPARGSAQLGSLTAPALLLRLRRHTRGLGKESAREGRCFCKVHIC